MVHTSQDAPHVIVFPPVIPIGTMLLAALLQWAFPFGLFARVPQLVAGLVGVTLIVLGIGFMASGRVALMRAGTNVHPTRPALALVENSIFRWTRNPLYLGGSIAMFGCAFLFGLDWLPLLFVASLTMLHFGIILREEDYLERKFGDEYRAYKARVPRYLGPF